MEIFEAIYEVDRLLKIALDNVSYYGLKSWLNVTSWPDKEFMEQRVRNNCEAEGKGN